MSMQVEEFLKLFKDDLDSNEKNIINNFLSLKTTDRIRGVLANSLFYRQSAVDNLIFKILYLLKKI